MIVCAGARPAFNWRMEPIFRLKNNKELNLDNIPYIHSDNFLFDSGYCDFMNKINQSFHTNKINKIVIIGGSHSAFNSALLLLYGP